MKHQVLKNKKNEVNILPKIKTQNKQRFTEYEEPSLITAICGKQYSDDELVYESCRQRRRRHRRKEKVDNDTL